MWRFHGRTSRPCHPIDISHCYCLPREWAPSPSDEAKLPATDGVDWRPRDTLPEDFYAA
ncbi:MAG TPA: hypothetical protein VMZ71_10280 [Gemmataceae bacterium]|nr:hypothetical protein [Gemmataceae bacterium]